jgi:hypothetical protein
VVRTSDAVPIFPSGSNFLMALCPAITIAMALYAND